MPIEGESLFQGRDALLAEMLAAYQTAVPDVYTSEDGNLRLFLSIFAGVYESIFVGLDVLREDMFVQTANPQALDRHATMFSVPRLIGTVAVGTLQFSGAGGTFVDTGAMVAHDPGNGQDFLYFLTTASGTIPNPGIPTAPVISDLATAGNLTGTFEYAIAFETTEGETEIGAESNAINVTASRIHLALIPSGGAGTLARRIYRSKDGGAFQLVATILDNTTVVYDDNITDGALGGNPPATSTAERITLAAEAEAPGVEYNVGPGVVVLPSDVPDGVIAVTNPSSFVDGSDDELTERFRGRLLETIRNPGTGSPSDLKSWSEAVAGVETATVYKNTDNTGAANPGHTLIRISGPNGTVPGIDVVNAVSAVIEARDHANVIYHIGTFVALPTNVTADVTPATGYTLADVTPGVQNAITEYINSLDVGETFYISGAIAVTKPLPGVVDVVITVPATNLTTAVDTKRIPGTILVI